MAVYRICYRCHADMAPQDRRLCPACVEADPARAKANAYMRDYFRQRRDDPAIRAKAKAQRLAARASRDKDVERAKGRERMMRWRSIPENAAKLIARHRALRVEVLDRYGRSCVCCGETREEFLTIDHINGGGRKHVQEIGLLYRWLKKHHWPTEGFRVLCMNCNFSRGRYGYCPHERERESFAHETMQTTQTPARTFLPSQPREAKRL